MQNNAKRKELKGFWCGLDSTFGMSIQYKAFFGIERERQGHHLIGCESLNGVSLFSCGQEFVFATHKIPNRLEMYLQKYWFDISHKMHDISIHI